MIICDILKENDVIKIVYEIIFSYYIFLFLYYILIFLSLLFLYFIDLFFLCWIFFFFLFFCLLCSSFLNCLHCSFNKITIKEKKENLSDSLINYSIQIGKVKSKNCKEYWQNQVVVSRKLIFILKWCFV